MRLSCSARAVSALPIDAALRPVGAGPAAGAGIGALGRHRCARHASDRGIALVVKRVVGHVVILDVVPDLLVGPSRRAGSASRARTARPSRTWVRRPGSPSRLCGFPRPSNSTPSRARAHRLDLAGRAAGVWVEAPEISGALARAAPARVDPGEPLELDPVALGERVAGGVGLGEEQLGVEVEEARLRVDPVRDVDDHRARLLERDGEARALGWKVSSAQAIDSPRRSASSTSAEISAGSTTRPSIIGRRSPRPLPFAPFRRGAVEVLVQRPGPRRITSSCRARPSDRALALAALDLVGLGAAPVDELVHRLEAELDRQRQVLDLRPRTGRCRPARRSR